MTYSNLAHIPWAVGLQLAGVGLFWLLGHQVTPATFWICGLGGWVAMFARDEAKQEFTFIELRFGGLRARMPDLFALQFWKWSAHNMRETAYALVAVAVVAIVGTLTTP